MPDAPTSRVKHSIGNGRGYPNDAEFGDALDSKWIDFEVLLVDESDIDRRDVGVSWHEVLVQPWVQQPRRVPVRCAGLEKGLANSHHPSPAHLTLGRPPIDNPARTPRPAHSLDAYQAQVGVDAHHHKPSAEGPRGGGGPQHALGPACRRSHA